MSKQNGRGRRSVSLGIYQLKKNSDDWNVDENVDNDRVMEVKVVVDEFQDVFTYLAGTTDLLSTTSTS